MHQELFNDKISIVDKFHSRDVLAERGVDLCVALVVVEPGDGGRVVPHGGE